MSEQTRTRTRTESDPKAKEVKIQLDFPIKVGGTEVGHVTVRRPKVRDRLVLEDSGGTDAQKEIRMLCNLANLSPDEVEDMDLGDYVKVSKVISGFIGAQPDNSGA